MSSTKMNQRESAINQEPLQTASAPETEQNGDELDDDLGSLFGDDKDDTNIDSDIAGSGVANEGGALEQKSAPKPKTTSTRPGLHGPLPPPSLFLPETPSKPVEPAPLYLPETPPKPVEPAPLLLTQATSSPAEQPASEANNDAELIAEMEAELEAGFEAELKAQTKDAKNNRNAGTQNSIQGVGAMLAKPLDDNRRDVPDLPMPPPSLHLPQAPTKPVEPARDNLPQPLPEQMKQPAESPDLAAALEADAEEIDYFFGLGTNGSAGTYKNVQDVDEIIAEAFDLRPKVPNPPMPPPSLHLPERPTAPITQVMEETKPEVNQEPVVTDPLLELQNELRAADPTGNDNKKKNKKSSAPKVSSQNTEGNEEPDEELRPQPVPQLPPAADPSFLPRKSSRSDKPSIFKWKYGDVINFGPPGPGNNYDPKNDPRKRPESAKKTGKKSGRQSAEASLPAKKLRKTIDLTSNTDGEPVVDNVESTDDSMKIIVGNNDANLGNPRQSYLTPMDNNFQQTPEIQLFSSDHQVFNNPSVFTPYSEAPSHSQSLGRGLAQGLSGFEQNQSPFMSSYLTVQQDIIGHVKHTGVPRLSDYISPYNSPEQVNIETLGTKPQVEDAQPNFDDGLSDGESVYEEDGPDNHEFGYHNPWIRYDEFKYLFPWVTSRSCFENEIAKQRAEDAILVANGQAIPIRKPIMRHIKLNYTQIDDLNQYRLRNGRKPFEPKLSAMKYKEQFIEAKKRKMAEEGYVEPEIQPQPQAKRPRLAPLTNHYAAPVNDHPMMGQDRPNIISGQRYYERFRVEELKNQCRARKLRTYGLKAALVNRLVEADALDQQAAAHQDHQQPLSYADPLGYVSPSQVPQQCQVPNGWGIDQNPPMPANDSMYGMGPMGNYQQSPPINQFSQRNGYEHSVLRPEGYGTAFQPSMAGGFDRAPGDGHMRPTNSSRGDNPYQMTGQAHGSDNGFPQQPGNRTGRLRVDHNFHQPTNNNSTGYGSDLQQTHPEDHYFNGGVHRPQPAGQYNHGSMKQSKSRKQPGNDLDGPQYLSQDFKGGHVASFPQQLEYNQAQEFSNGDIHQSMNGGDTIYPSEADRAAYKQMYGVDYRDDLMGP